MPKAECSKAKKCEAKKCKAKLRNAKLKNAKLRNAKLRNAELQTLNVSNLLVRVLLGYLFSLKMGSSVVTDISRPASFLVSQWWLLVAALKVPHEDQ